MTTFVITGFYWTKTRLLFTGTLTNTTTLRVSARGQAIRWPDSSACFCEQVELTQPEEAPKATRQDPQSHSGVPKPPYALCLLRLVCAQRGTYLSLSDIFITNALCLSENTSTGCWHTALTSGYLSLSLALSCVGHRSSLKSIPLIVSELRRPHVLHLSPVESTVKCYVSSGRALTEAWRPHTAPRDPEMRVNKPSEPSLTPCVVTYGTDW